MRDEMLEIGGVCVRARLVVLDKDGTLIAFDRLWHAWLEAFWRDLEGRLALTEEAREGLAASLGLDRCTGAWDPLGPLTLAATSEVSLIAASQVYRYLRLAWPAAQRAVEEANQGAYRTLPLDQLVEPVGDVPGLVRRLHERGVRVALATADDRAPTVETLDRLGWGNLFEVVLCGDDGLPNKPSPDMAIEICQRLNVLPQDAIMVGDTIADMEMARAAGFRLAVGVTSGALTRELLAPYADVVVPDVHALRIVNRADCQI
jgi:phosphoglycolate phosphatase